MVEDSGLPHLKIELWGTQLARKMEENYARLRSVVFPL